ncbi:MAG: N-acetylmuramoyl-L-alanine amidase [Treponema sp.]|jgi:N-acetylmuramoyl-L-alanine amidase|nr:N-acetylmuramoyl-L-alanine amidase [Treponema sp.]
MAKRVNPILKHRFFLWLLLAAPFVAAQPQDKTFSLQDALAILPEFQWDPFLQTGTFYSSGHYASFQAGFKGERCFSLIDGYEVISAPSPYLENGALRFPESFIISLKNAIDAEIKNDLKPFKVAAIILDPGHGGKDSGATAVQTINGKTVSLKEKDITLAIALNLRDRLVKRYPDKKILMTRATDVTLALEARASFANGIKLEENEAIIFVSIHCNSEMNANLKKNPARGYEIWYLPPKVRREIIEKDNFNGSEEVRSILNTLKEEEFTYESKLLAASLLTRFDEFIAPASPSRGIKEEQWYVVKRTNMPSVLIELGFISNPSDAALLFEKQSLEKYTKTLFEGLVDFVTLYEKPGGFSIIE